MKEKLNEKEQHKLYTLFIIYTSNIAGKTNQFKHNSLFIYSASNIVCLFLKLSPYILRLDNMLRSYRLILSRYKYKYINMHVSSRVLRLYMLEEQ